MDQRLSLPASPDAIAQALAVAERAARDQLTRVISEHFRELEPALRAAHQEWADRLNQYFRRMRAYESDRDWCEAVLDAAAGLCRRAAFFSIRAGEVCFQGSRGMPAPDVNPPGSVRLADAPAFLRAVQNREIAIAARNTGELSHPIADSFGQSEEKDAALIPVAAGDRIPGVLYAEGATDLGALEMIANFAGSSLENHLLLEEGPPVARIRPAEYRAPEQAAARRFASVAVARMILHEFEAVGRGRLQHSLYACCARSIDYARERYQKEFFDAHPDLPDYLHREIVQTLAQDQPELLGPGYPGPLARGRSTT